MRNRNYLAAVMLLAITNAHAELSVTLSLTSDFDIRGISQTSEEPALQGSLDWSTASGFYSRFTGSNVEMVARADYRFEIYSGFSGETSAGLGWDLGAGYYGFHPADDQMDFGELYAGMRYRAFAVKVWYAPRFAGTRDSAVYAESNASFGLPLRHTLLLHVGHSFGDAIRAGLGEEYTDYSVGVARVYENLQLSLRYVGTSLEQRAVGDARFIVSLTVKLAKR